MESFHDAFAGGYHTSCMFFNPGSCDPPWGMFWVGLCKRVKEHTCSFDVTNFSLALKDGAIEIDEVVLWVDRPEAELEAWSSFNGRALS